MKNIENIVTKIIKECTNNPIVSINVEDDLVDLGINSFAFIKIIVEIEKEFNLEIEDSFLDINKFNSVGSLIDFVKDKLDNKTE